MIYVKSVLVYPEYVKIHNEKDQEKFDDVPHEIKETIGMKFPLKEWERALGVLKKHFKKKYNNRHLEFLMITINNPQ